MNNTVTKEQSGSVVREKQGRFARGLWRKLRNAKGNRTEPN